MKFIDQLKIIVIVAGISLVGNFVGFKNNPLEALPGMIILVLMVLAGIGVSKVVPVKITPVAYIALIATILTSPYVPFSSVMNEYIAKVSFLSLTTPILAYAGIAIGKDLDDFKKLGPKIILISILVFVGTFVGSAIVAHFMLKVTGLI